MVVGFITTYAISSYHHWWCEFESRSGRGVQHYVIKFASDLRQVDCFLRILHQYNWPPRYCWNVVESDVKHHQTNKQTTGGITFYSKQEFKMQKTIGIWMLTPYIWTQITNYLMFPWLLLHASKFSHGKVHIKW